MTADQSGSTQDSFPYAYAAQHLDAVLAEIRRGALPEALDSSLLKRAGLAGSSATGVQRCFRSFGFIDESSTFTQRGSKLRSTGPDSHKAFLEALGECYPHLWPRLGQQDFQPSDLDDYIRMHMTQGEAARRSARKTFLWLVRQSGNDAVADRLEPSKGSNPARPKAAPRAKKPAAPAQPRQDDAPVVDRPSAVIDNTNGSATEPSASHIQLDQFGVLSQILEVKIDSSSSPELVSEIREMLVVLLGVDRPGGHDANS